MGHPPFRLCGRVQRADVCHRLVRPREEIRPDDPCGDVLLPVHFRPDHAPCRGFCGDGRSHALRRVCRPHHRLFPGYRHPLRCIHRRHRHPAAGAEKEIRHPGFRDALCDGFYDPCVAACLPGQGENPLRPCDGDDLYGCRR